jgi:hypothetical protein
MCWLSLHRKMLSVAFVACLATAPLAVLGLLPGDARREHLFPALDGRSRLLLGEHWHSCHTDAAPFVHTHVSQRGYRAARANCPNERRVTLGVNLDATRNSKTNIFKFTNIRFNLIIEAPRDFHSAHDLETPTHLTPESSSVVDHSSPHLYCTGALHRSSCSSTFVKGA